MNIAIIGAGKMGQSYGSVWANAGHSITFGVRQVEDPKHKKLAQLLTAQIMPTHEAVKNAEVVLFVVPGAALSAVAAGLVAAGLELTGKVLIDATNGNPPGASVQLLQKLHPEASVVRAFNYYGYELPGHSFSGRRATAFLCGDDNKAKERVAQLARDAGFEPLDIGALANAATQDGLLPLWFTLSKQLGTRFLGLEVLHESD
jgi:8-hydroxy-5-deazaflavin:NADPH oxidoreductase